MRKILAIGNSFSEDAFYYLHDIAKAGGIDTKVVNLYVGGCSLRQHMDFFKRGAKEYMYQLNGELSERYVSVEEILKEEEWDIIMTQQASHDSGLYETYFPYLSELISVIREKCPKAKLFLHQTWAYEIDSDHPEFSRYHCNQKEMFEGSSLCYEKAAELTGLVLIPSGKIVQEMRKTAPFRYELGEKSLCRDGFHMDMVYGRYLLGAVLYQVFFNKNITENTFVPQEASEEIIEIMRNVIGTFYKFML